MTNAVSRVVVAVVLLPVVLGAVYLGHWWLFALIALAAAVSLHEYWLMARALAPLRLAGYISGVLAPPAARSCCFFVSAGVLLFLLGFDLSGLDWMLGGLMSVFALGFLFKA